VQFTDNIIFHLEVLYDKCRLYYRKININNKKMDGKRYYSF